MAKESIDQFRPQVRNSNKHSPRGMGALEASMRKHGYVAPMTAAANGELIDGSARLETSANVFGDDVLVVRHDGQKPIVMIRTDIPTADTPEARAISIAANRIAELNLDYDVEILMEDMQAGIDMTGLFSETDLSSLMAGFRFENGAGNYGEGGNPLDAQDAGVPDVEFKEYDESVENDVEMCECPSCGHKFPK